MNWCRVSSGKCSFDSPIARQAWRTRQRCVSGLARATGLAKRRAATAGEAQLAMRFARAHRRGDCFSRPSAAIWPRQATWPCIGDERSADSKDQPKLGDSRPGAAVRTYKARMAPALPAMRSRIPHLLLFATFSTSSPWTMSQAVNLDHAMFWAPPTRIATKRVGRVLAQTERSQSNSSSSQADEFQANPFSAPGQAPDDAISIDSDTESVLDEVWESDADREGDVNSRVHGSLEDDTLPTLGAIIASLAKTRPDLAIASSLAMPSQIRTLTAASDATIVAERAAASGVLAGDGDAGLLERPWRDSSQGQQDGTKACPAAPSSPTEPVSILPHTPLVQTANACPAKLPTPSSTDPPTILPHAIERPTPLVENGIGEVGCVPIDGIGPNACQQATSMPQFSMQDLAPAPEDKGIERKNRGRCKIAVLLPSRRTALDPSPGPWEITPSVVKSCSDSNADCGSTSSSDAGGDVPGDEDYGPSPPHDGEVEDNSSVRALTVDSEDDCDEPPRKRFRKGRALESHSERRQRHGSSLCSSATEAVAATAGRRPSPYNLPSPPSAYDSFEGGDSGDAEFEEWPLENASLKRIVVNGQVTFQLQFGGAAHWHGLRVGDVRYASAAKKRSRRMPNPMPGGAFTADEDGLLIRLKEMETKLSWSQIYQRFNTAFPDRRSQASLQVRYSTRLKDRSGRVRCD